MAGLVDNLPQMAASSYATSTFDLNSLGGVGNNVLMGQLAAGAPSFMLPAGLSPLPNWMQQIIDTKEKEMTGRRMVQVFVCDTDESVPLIDSMIYAGAAKLTDSTDQELFYELEIKNLLEEHNKKRITFPDKKLKDRNIVQYLEPARVRDLKMVVTTIAAF